MPGPRPPVAPHVQAALARGTGQSPVVAPTAQLRATAPCPPQAAHVQAALAHTAPVPSSAVQRLPAPPLPTLQPKLLAPPVAQPKEEASARPALPGRDASGFVTYSDQKTPTTPPPPPRWPIYSLHCGEHGGCRIQDVRTGRFREPGTMYAGFVRMGAAGVVYVSPRPDPRVLGDSHPTIAAGTPEGQAGRRQLVAAGEVGIIDNRIVGHNDKTGHYRTRKNYWQSGMPADLYHPFTEDPLSWYKAAPRPGERRQKGTEAEAGENS